MGLIETILVIIGSGGISGFITWVVTVKSQKQKEQALADQEGVKAKADLSTLERDIYLRLSTELDERLQRSSGRIGELEDTVKDMEVTIKLQTDNIKHLERVVNDYKQTCDNCKFRIEKKSNEINTTKPKRSPN
jgi:chromosome segregation ATPase